MHTLVIARYSEALDWITQVPENFRVVIYNKGKPILDPAIRARADQIIARSNFGRESETYVHHMLGHDGPGDAFTVFSQGDPFEHSPDFLALLARCDEWDDVQALAWQWREDRNIPPACLLADAQTRLGDALRVRLQLYSLRTWGPIDFLDIDACKINYTYRTANGGLPEGTNIAAHLFRRLGLHAIADEAERHLLGQFSYGAVFAVRNNRIAALPRPALETLYDYSCMISEANGYVLERLWLHLFGARFVIPKDWATEGPFDYFGAATACAA